MPDPIHSTGRGGAGNIGQDPSTTYIDGSITREGPLGESSRGGDYSAGRGGAGNIVDPPHSVRGSSSSPAPPAMRSEDVVPETAMRSAEGYENYHTGRGGQGNVHRDAFGGHSGPGRKEGKGEGGLLEKAKAVFGGAAK
ncbi:hypothetical protein LTR35_014920 [Friedmanniomyces endolithicus]|uniref:Uncharacterized protein n=1 Tax=Friedmanniomyces endolithicus TaxID=329885 RepID=A0AAN6FMF5_9PEZI|nr:hypothetical protein LTR35_014920 [Friedmanniomyces endolithicus]KAK0285273.1 hypothetical protein LTS00_010902 [Friedmanniomyces endolithicus]KAK0321088.1 hypothetical protein LTR82_008005 [Friedmanniomyces endolithicus]KAK0984178.1 hypothetical protein LTR54_014079 [Friedmanniomyces endolithicus]